MEVMVGFRYLYGMIQEGKILFQSEPWMSMEYCMTYSLYHEIL